MADSNRSKCQDIPFLIDGVAKIVKSVNKQTTCNDVINKLPSLQCPLAVFESVNGIEKELVGKTKLLKTWRSHVISDRVIFLVKKSERTVLKRSRSGLLAEIKAHRRSSTLFAKESLKKVTDLAFYVRYQKTKVQNVKRKFDEVDTTYEDRAKKVINHFTSPSSSSMCRSEYGTSEDVQQASDNNGIYTGMRNMRLGLKEKFSSKSKTAKRTTSASTISSTDSGSKLVTSEGQSHHVTSLMTQLAKRSTLMNSNLGDFPRHSTPMIARSFGKVECDTEENDPFDLSFYDEIEGKDAIMKKFMADQQKMTQEIDSRPSIGCYGFAPEIEDHVRPSRFSLPAFKSQKEKCRYLWDKNCDSDSDTSSLADDSAVWNASQLDNAFIDSIEDIHNSDFDTPINRTLGRESAMSNLKSVTSESQDHQVKGLTTKLAKRPSFMDINLGDVPRHSTPMIARSFGKVECDTEVNDPFDLSFYDEIEGKDAFLKKFMADQEKMAKEIDSRPSIGCYGFAPEIEDHGRASRFSLPAFRSQKEKCRYLWDKNCDSDSDTSSVTDDSAVWNASKLDNASIDNIEDISNSASDTPINRILRRESAMSNLKQFSMQVMPIDIEDDYNSFNYSFDCTFPRMDESQSVDFSGCFGKGLNHDKDNVGDATFDGESEDNVTRELLTDTCDDSIVESDEGLGSMQSVSVQDIVGMYV